MSVDIFKVFQLVLEFIFATIEEISLKILKIFVPKKPKVITGQLALVTGSAQGLGRALANRIGAEGCNLALVDINHMKNQKVADEIREKFPGIKVEAFSVDVSKNEEIEMLKVKINEKLGKVDILINNAAILEFKNSIFEGLPEDYYKVMNVNLMSHFWTIRTFLPDMVKSRRGHIIAMSSFGAKFSFPFTAIYLCSKAAIDSLMRTLSEELHCSNLSSFIKTTTVYPSMINSESLQELKRIQGIVTNVDAINKSNRNEPSVIADEIVRRGLLLEQEEIYLPKLEVCVLYVVKKMPYKLVTMVWKLASMSYYNYLMKRAELYNKMK